LLVSLPIKIRKKTLRGDEMKTEMDSYSKIATSNEQRATSNEQRATSNEHSSMTAQSERTTPLLLLLFCYVATISLGALTFYGLLKYTILISILAIYTMISSSKYASANADD
jgi:hypothetical protein